MKVEVGARWYDTRTNKPKVMTDTGWSPSPKKDIQQLRRRYEQRVGRRDQLQSQLEEAEKSLRKLQRQSRIAEQAQLIVKAVALETQAQLEYHISGVVTAAQEAVFGDSAYHLSVQFIDRRNRTECDLAFSRNDQLVDPLSSTGYGTVDVAAFALRAACWSMMPNISPVIILDEPFRHLKGATSNLRAIQMVKEVSAQLNLQVIMVSDERSNREDIIESADKVFEVTIANGFSQINSI